jgi:1-acyl-sn-glycerol-3-phosphate acyltransferase
VASTPSQARRAPAAEPASDERPRFARLAPVAARLAPARSSGRSSAGGVAPPKPEPERDVVEPAETAANAELDGFRERSLSRGVNPILYWAVRGVLVPFFLVYFRMRRIGREHIPQSGPLLFASNHRSFLDPFFIGMLVRRPVYYLAKRELFEKRWQARILNALGAFPVDRGAGDSGAIDTARAILQRGDCVVIFPEGTRVRPGPLGRPKRGIGRLALEAGVPVVPVAVLGTEDVRRGWRIRPRRVYVRAGKPLRFPTDGTASPARAAGVTDRIWACVSLQWEWLGGVPAPREEQPRTPARRARPRRAHQISSTRGGTRAA